MPPEQSGLTGALDRPSTGRPAGDDSTGFGGEQAANFPAGPPILREPSDAPVTTPPQRPDRRSRREAREAAETEAKEKRDRSRRSLRRPVEAPVGPAAGPTLLTEVSAEAPGRRQRKKANRLRARKVKRIVRRIDAWSVLKVAFLFYLCAYVVSMVAVVLLWRLAVGAGVVENVEDFLDGIGFGDFRFIPDQLFEGVAILGAVLAVMATGLTALGAVLFNLISDLVGGIRMTVIEEPGWKPERRQRRSKPAGDPRSTSGTVPRPSEAPPRRRPQGL